MKHRIIIMIKVHRAILIYYNITCVDFICSSRTLDTNYFVQIALIN